MLDFNKLRIKLFLEDNNILEHLRIHRIEIEKEKITIYLENPGILIGKAGTIINKMTQYFKKEIKLIEYSPFDK